MKTVKVAVYLQDYYSEDSEEQLNNEEKNLIEYIKKDPSWKYIRAYKDTDRNFPSYNLEKLIKESQRENIEIIIAGSLSRFNKSLDSAIDTIDRILSMEIRVILFEEDIDSNSSVGKMLLGKLKRTLSIEKKLSSINRKWTFDRMYEEGNIPFFRLLGYKEVDNEWVIIPEEAKIVREAFKLHLEGLSLLDIARRFIYKKYKKANGRLDWTSIAIKNMIKNEKYVGDVLCRKAISEDDSELKIKKEQYLIKDHHEAIISREDFEKANKILKESSIGDDKIEKNKYPLSRKLKCGLCGSNFQRYISRDKVFWRCGTHIKSKSLCPMTSLNEETIKKAMVTAFLNKFKDILNNFRLLIDFLGRAETYKEDIINPLYEKIDQIIEEENQAVLNGDLDKQKTLKKEKSKTENLLKDKMETLKIIEKDYGVRVKAIGILNDLIDENGTISDLRKSIDNLWLLRAFIVRVTINPNQTYDIEWIDNDHSTVEIEVGE